MRLSNYLIAVSLLTVYCSTRAAGQGGNTLPVQDEAAGSAFPKSLILDWYFETAAIEGHLYKEIGVNSSGEFMYVADPGTDAVVVLSTDNPAVPIETFSHPSWLKSNVFPYAVDVSEDGMVYVSSFDILNDGINDNALWRWDPVAKTLAYLCELPQPVRGIQASGEGLNTVVYASGNGLPPSNSGIVMRCTPISWDAFTVETLFSTGVYRNQQDAAASHNGKRVFMSAWGQERREWYPGGPSWTPYESKITAWDDQGNRDDRFSVSYIPQGNVPSMSFNPELNRLYCLHLGIDVDEYGGITPHEASIYKVNPKTGNLIDMITIAPSGTSGGGGIDAGVGGGIYLAWTIGGGRSALAKVRDLTAEEDGEGSVEATFADDRPEGRAIHSIPTDFALQQNYPNPFNPSTTIAYDLPAEGFTMLKVYDMLGQEVAVLVNEIQTAGYKSAEFNASGLPSGMYLYRLTAGDFVATKKLVLLK